MTLLQRTHKGFEREGIPYMFVGGVANQAHIAKFLCDYYKDNLLGLVKSQKIRVQDHLRATDDVDIVTRFRYVEDSAESRIREIDDAKKIFSVLDYIVEDEEYFSPSEENIVKIILNKRGHVRPTFRLGINDVVDSDKIASFNIYKGPKDLKNGILKEFEDRFYDIFLNGAVNVDLPYSDKGNITLRVKDKDHLLATKIARGRPKDINDALSLIKYGKLVDQEPRYPIVENILCCEDQRYHVKSEELCKRYEAFRKLADTLN